MERGERIGLGVAAAAHLALLALLSLGTASRPPRPIKLSPPIDVQIVDAIGAQSAAPVTAQEAPAPSTAPDVGPPEEAAPAEPEPAPAPPKPTPPEPAPAPAPAPPKPTPAPPKPVPPKPVPPKPVPAPPKPAPEPEPRPAPVKPKPAPAPRPAPKPVPVKPAPAKAAPAPAPAKSTPAKPAPAKPAPAKAAPAKPAPAKAALSASPAKSAAATPAKASPAKAAPAKPAAAPAAKPGAGKAAQTRGGIASDDFLKGITPEKSPGKAQAPRAQAISALAMNGLAAAIKRQIQPCYELGPLAGTSAMSIVTVLNLRFNRDGTVAGTTIVSQTTNDSNRSYAKQVADVSKGAVLRCAPLKLPPELYAGGWDNLNFRFTPGQMQ